MSRIAKEQALMLKLKENMKLQFPSFTMSEAADAHGAKLLMSADATPATGEQVWAIRICKYETEFKDSVQMSQDVYAPLRIQIIEEESAVAGISVLTAVNKIKMDVEIAKMGLNQERFMNANGTVAALAQFTADGAVSGSTLIASVAADSKWPLSGQ